MSPPTSTFEHYILEFQQTLRAASLLVLNWCLAGFRQVATANALPRLGAEGRPPATAYPRMN